MQAMDPIDFEHYCAWLYTKEGYKVADTKTSGDEGIDLLLTKGNKKVVVQCKRYSGNVGQPVVRDLYGAMFHVAATEAHLCTTGRISRQAESWAAGKPIELLDGSDMVAWANKWRRQEVERSGASIIWTTATVAVVGVVIVAALALMAGGWFFFNRRTNRPEPTPVLSVPVLPTVTPSGQSGIDQPVTQITPLPTEEATETPEETPEEEPEETVELAPTTTLRPTDEPPTSVPAAVNVEVPRRSADILIDGSLDEWGDPITTANVTVYTSSQWDGTDDSESSWYLAWDEQALFIAALVIDDVHAQYSTGPEIFRGDSLEIQFDTDRDGDFGNGVSADEFQLEISPGNFGDLAPEAWRFAGSNSGQYLDSPGHQIVVAAEETPFGYFIEARIPWSNINVSPSAGLVIGANLNVNDNDTAGPLQEMMKSNVPSRSYANPTTWGTLTLR